MRKKIDSSNFRHLYEDEELSWSDIARMKGYALSSVVNAAHKLGIKSRPPGDTARLTYKRGRKPWDKGLRGEQAPNWKGGIMQDEGGYRRVWNHGRRMYEAEHRIIIEQHLGRKLLPKEYVHHINGIKDDNRIENLELMSIHNHTLLKRMCTECRLRKDNARLQRRIGYLETTLNLTLGGNFYPVKRFHQTVKDGKGE